MALKGVPVRVLAGRAAVGMGVAACALVAACGVRGGGDAGPQMRAAQHVVKRDTTGAAGPGPAAPAQDTIERIDAPAGAAFVVPIDPELLKSGKKPRLLLDDGLELESTLYRVSTSALPHNPADPWDLWLGPAQQWQSGEVTAREAAELLATEEGTRTGFALLVQPKAGRTDNAVWLGQQRVPMQWLPSAESLTGADAVVGAPEWWSPLPEAARGQVNIDAVIAREARDPLTSWRAALLRDGLRPGAQRASFEDPLIDALARQFEQRWRVAFLRLWQADHALCERVKRRVAGIAVVEPGLYAPVWETDHNVLNRLLLDLLNASFSDARRAQLAEQWLEEQPQAAAWVVDEGGTLPGDTGGTPVPAVTISLLNMTTKPAAAWIALPKEGTPAEMDPLAPMGAVALTRVIPMLVEGVPSEFVARVGEWTRSVKILPTPYPVRPPGLATGYFAADLTLAGLIAGRVEATGEEWGTAALLHRPARAEADAVAPEYRLWELYVECRVPAAGVDRSRESLSVYVGPFGAPTGAWRVGHDGAVTSVRPQDERVAAELGPEVARAKVTDMPDRWIARVPLPPGSIGADGVMQIGLAREDASGRRSAWPRALPPWQDEPARARVDVSAWNK